LQGWYTLKEWRRPRKFRTVNGHYPRNIYQIDIAHFKTFFEKLRIPTTIARSFPNPYGLICIDVYSRFAWGEDIAKRDKTNFRWALIHIFGVMGRPEIISGDNEIISRIFGDPEFQGINLYATTTHEINKNAIVERFIRTLKNYILKILADPNVEFNRFVDFTTQLIQKACIMYSNSYHRIIQAIPIDVFEGRDTNKQEIIRFEYEEIPKDTIVLRKPFKEKIGVSVLDYDVELYVVEYKAGDDDKYYTAPLYIMCVNI
jgi:hypothetical protein